MTTTEKGKIPSEIFISRDLVNSYKENFYAARYPSPNRTRFIRADIAQILISALEEISGIRGDTTQKGFDNKLDSRIAVEALYIFRKESINNEI